MQNLLKHLLDKLGSPNEQKSEKIALFIIYCMFLAFGLTCAVGIVSVLQIHQLADSTSQKCLVIPHEKQRQTERIVKF